MRNAVVCVVRIFVMFVGDAIAGPHGGNSRIGGWSIIAEAGFVNTICIFTIMIYHARLLEPGPLYCTKLLAERKAFKHVSWIAENETKLSRT